VRVAYFTNNPNLGSTARILRSWLGMCGKQGVEPVLVGRADGDMITATRTDGVEAYVDNMPFMERRRPWIAMFHGWRVARLIRNPCLLHFNEHDIYPFQRVLRYFCKVPTVCHVRYKLDRGFAQWAFQGNRMPDALLWTSNQQKADSAEAIAGIVPENRQYVVRLGIDLQSFGKDESLGRSFRKQWSIEDDEILVGMAAPLRPRKRIEDFLELIVRIARQHPKVIGVLAGGEIAGDEEYRSRMESQIARTGLGRRLRWVGNLEPVEPFHLACDISVSTSEYETFGNSVCEAMACGKPVVGYVGGSVGEVLGDTGIVVETGDISALASGVGALIGNEFKRKELGRMARSRVASEFSPESSFNQVRSIYAKVLGSGT
jgi:L-malate glycosyltransferase